MVDIMAKPLLYFAPVLKRTGSEVIASHIHTLAGDYANLGKLEVRMNVDVKLVHKDSGAYTIFVTTTEPVLTPKGFVDYISFSFGHMSDTALYNKFKVGDIIPAGTLLYKEGTRSGGKNGAVGSHIHARIHRGTLKLPFWQNTSTGNWDLISTGGKMHHYDAFFVLPETQIIKVGNPADTYPYVVFNGQGSYETWIPPKGTMVDVQGSKVNRRANPNGLLLTGGFAPTGKFPILESTKDFIGGYQWCRCEGIEGWVALIDGTTVWVDPIIENPKPIDPPITLPPAEGGDSNMIIEELKKQVSLLEKEMKAKDDKISALEKTNAQLEKELDATILSSNENQKKIDEIKKVLA